MKVNFPNCDGDGPRYESILAEQKKNWPKHIEGAEQGNPHATLCLHCYGRHEPPHGEICPYDPPSISRQGAEYDRRRN